MRRARPFLLLLLFLLLAGARAAGADELPLVAQARQEMTSLRFAHALDLLDEALKSGRNGPHEVAEIHRLAGYAAGAIDREAVAVERFRQALSIEPDAVLEEGTSPKILGPFEQARAAIREKGALKVRSEPVPGRRAVAVVVENDPGALVAGARITLPTGVLEAKGTGRVIVPVEGPGVVHAEVAVVDAFGNALVIGRTVDVPEIPPAPGPVLQAPKSDRSGDGGGEPEAPALYERWYLWGAGSMVGLGLGVVFGLQARAGERDLRDLNEATANGEEHDISEALALVDRAKRDALIANIGFGVGGALGVVAGILLARDALRSDRLEAAASVGEGGASVTVRVRF